MSFRLRVNKFWGSKFWASRLGLRGLGAEVGSAGLGFWVWAFFGGLEFGCSELCVYRGVRLSGETAFSRVKRKICGGPRD